jgi:hypothetical protein
VIEQVCRVTVTRRRCGSCPDILWDWDKPGNLKIALLSDLWLLNHIYIHCSNLWWDVSATVPEPSWASWSVKHVHVLLGLVGLIVWLGSLAVLCSFLAGKEADWWSLSLLPLINHTTYWAVTVRIGLGV